MPLISLYTVVLDVEEAWALDTLSACPAFVVVVESPEQRLVASLLPVTTALRNSVSVLDEDRVLLLSRFLVLDRLDIALPIVLLLRAYA